MRTTARVLEALTNTNERLIAMTQQLRCREESSRVTHEMHLQGYGNGPAIEFYVYAKLKNGRDPCWCLEIDWNEDKWIIRSSVVFNQEGEEETFREFPERIAKCVDEVIVELDEATTALVASSDCFDHFTH